MSSLTGRLADFIATTRFSDLPGPVVAEAKRLILDTLGCALGSVATPSGRIAIAYAREMGGPPAATVLGAGMRAAPTGAAYANARLANVLDADDTFPTGTHFANATLFAALALGEQRGCSGAELLTAMAVGFDVGARIGSWMGAPITIEDGRVTGYAELGGPSATMSWAAVAAAASIAGLDAARTAHALGIAGANTPLPSLRKWSEQTELPMHKYADAGWCAQTGVAAVALARLGSTGFAAVLDGPNGFWKFFGQRGHDDAALLAGLGADWQILNTTYKPWPSCRWTHYPLTAFMRLKQALGLRPEEIEQVTVRANPFALAPRFRVAQPREMIAAEFSHAHVIAMGALDIPPGPRWYDPAVLDAAPVRALRDRVRVEPEPSAANLAAWMQGGQFRRIPGGVDITARGSVHSATVDMAWGDPWSAESHFADTALREKFSLMLAGSAPPSPAMHALADRLIMAVEGLETAPDLGGLAALLAQCASPQA